mmetsp:Transcript_56460/g.165762  ORF Transcript_56460/g.165762 Transcript_56460/m.165762 type:complete len:119 (+) Transcript_56460:430-786(+)
MTRLCTEEEEANGDDGARIEEDVCATIALWTKPDDWPSCGGAVIIPNLPSIFMFDGVRPDGTSMKVFFTGSGWPLLVKPRRWAAPLVPAACPGGLNTASERGAGRLSGIQLSRGIKSS